MVTLVKLDTAAKSGWVQRDEVKSERFSAVQPDEELHSVVSLDAKFESSLHTEKVLLIHSFHFGKLSAHDSRRKGRGQGEKGRHLYSFLNSYKTKCKVDEILQHG